MTEHWLEHAHGRIVAGDDEPDVLADYGWVQITDRERVAINWALATLCTGEPDAGQNREAAAVLTGMLERLSSISSTERISGAGNTLTDDEREAIGNMVHLIETCHDECGKDAHHLRKLLERLA